MRFIDLRAGTGLAHRSLMRRLILPLVLFCGVLMPAALASAQATAPTQTPPANPLLDPDRPFRPLQPDFTLINLPTTLRMPLHRSSFRITHRFGRPLGDGDFADLASDAFGFDSGALVGIEYRFGLMRGLHVDVARTSDKTIAFSGQKSLVQQGEASPVGAGLVASLDGTDNFSEEFSPSLGFVLSREITGVGAVYLQPMWVGNVNIFEPFIVADDNTILLALGTRVRIRPTVYLLGEFVPRLSGYDLGTHFGAFAIEKRSGGHSFQINVSNGTGTLASQLARGGTASDDWYIGFNISRKFF